MRRSQAREIGSQNTSVGKICPAMPYPAYTKMTDGDVLAIRSYLATIAPIKHSGVSNQLPFPFNIRLAMAFWNQLNFPAGQYPR
jgi:mono/diheme cytochrome c family protein